MNQKKSTLVQTGLALAGAGPNARPRRRAPLTSGVITSSCQVNRAYDLFVEDILA